LVRKFEEKIPEFKEKYYSKKSHIENAVLIICVHIRRGDIVGSFLCINTSIFRKIVSEVTAVLEARGISYKVHVFTQGDLCDFDVPGVEIFSDVDAI
jgi:hypothetical protein